LGKNHLAAIVAITLGLFTGAGWRGRRPAWTTDARTGCKIWFPLPLLGTTQHGRVVRRWSSRSPGIERWFVDGQQVNQIEDDIMRAVPGSGRRHLHEWDQYVGELGNAALQRMVEAFSNGRGDRYEGDFTGGELNGQGTFIL